jgi:hypothetical protein
MKTAILIYLLLVAGSVLTYKRFSRDLKKKDRYFFDEGQNFNTYRIFYRFILFPYDYIRLIYKWLYLKKTNEMGYMEYQFKRTDPELYRKLQILKKMKKQALTKNKSE